MSAGSAAGGAASGAGAGWMAGPWGALIGAGIGLFGSLFGAHKQSQGVQQQVDAAKYAADLQAKATAEALAYTRAQADREYAMAESTRHANYDQWAAAQRRLGTVGQMLGLGDRDIPAYVPFPGAGGGSTGAPSANQPPQGLQDVYASVRAQGAPTANSLNDFIAAARAKGYDAQPFMYGNTPSGNEVLVNGQKLKLTVGDAGQPNAGWYQWGANDGGGGRAVPRPGMRIGTPADYLNVAAPVPVSPGLQMPGYRVPSAGSYF